MSSMRSKNETRKKYQGLGAKEIRYQISLEIPAVTKFLVKYEED